MSIKIEPPHLSELRPRIVVIGVGGAGGNAINNMIASGLTGVEYVAANTDAQALAASSAERRLQLGASVTEGLGAGAKPEVGRAAAEEALDEIRSEFAGAHMAFITAGMGGGTGTGAAAVIAKAVKELGLLTVAIVSKPFHFEGGKRMRIADAGIEELRKHVDTLIVIPNQNLFRIATDRTTFAEAFVLADQVLYSGVACIVDLILKEGLINLDFADVRTILADMGTAVMGTGEADGAHRATLAAEEAITNPLLDDVALDKAQGVLISIIGGPDMTLFEVDEAVNRIRSEVDPEANIIVGAAFDTALTDRIRVSILASGMDRGDRAARLSEAADLVETQSRSADGSRERQESWVPAEEAAEKKTVGSWRSSLLPASVLFGKQATDERKAAHSPPPPPPPPLGRTSAGPSATAAPAEAESGRPAEHRPKTPDPSSSQPPQATATAWQPQEDVVIEPIMDTSEASSERFSRQSYFDPSDEDAARAKGGAAALHRATFEPALPREGRRPGQHELSVSDFPPHAQKEYFAKRGGGDPNVAGRQRAGSANRFARWAGLGRGGESPGASGRGEPSDSNPPSNNAKRGKV